MKQRQETRQPHYQRFAELIRNDIIAGVYPQGSRLKIPELCTRYETSAIPVREALQSLSGDGLVVITPNRGATVRLVDAEFVDEILQVRQILETFLVRRFIEVCDVDQVARLHELQDRMEHCEERGDWAGRVEADLHFHATIAHSVGNSEINRIIERQSRIGGAVFSRYGQSPFRRKQVREEHRAILAAIEQHDAEESATLISRHFDNTRREIIDSMRREKWEDR